MPAKRILVVDDEPDIREVAQVSLEVMGGLEVLTASSGREALEIAARERPDAILLDVMMPELDGPATVERLRATPGIADIPIVLLTAKVQAADHRRFAALPVSGVLAKPFDPMTLSEQVIQALGW